MNIASIDDKSKGNLAFQDSVVFEEDSEPSIISINDSTRPDKKFKKVVTKSLINIKLKCTILF